jgi:Zn-dependent M28 family amino/carboxypeptidase
MADVNRLCGDEFAGRGSYQAGSALASQFLVDEFEALGFEVVRQKVRGRYAENIIAVKAGDDTAVMVSAHHDHLGIRQGKTYRGADDNASGVAVLLAIARSRAVKDYKHTVLFVSFGAEEDGLVGSGVYIHDPYWPLKSTKAMINFDMVGRNFFEAGANQEATVAVVGLESHPTAKGFAEAAAATVGLNMVAVPARLLELFGLHDRTDDWWFRRQNIPSIHFSTGLHGDYHQVSDTVDKILPSQLSRISSMAAQVLDGLAGDGRKP